MEIMEVTDSMKITVEKAKKWAIAANIKEIDEVMKLIEKEAKSGNSSITLENPKEAVLQYLEIQGFFIKVVSEVGTMGGDYLTYTWKISW